MTGALPASPGAGAHDRVTLSSGELAATFVPALGMLGTSLRHRGEEFLALPGGVAAYRAGRMTGFPVVAPWANRLGARRYRASGVTVDLDGLDLHTDENGLPIHGTLRAQPWEVVAVEREGDVSVLHARFRYGSPALLAAFPFPHELRLEVEVWGTALSVRASLRPTGEIAVPVSFGFHPYFRLPRAPRASWRLELPARRHVRLDPRGIPTGAEDEAPEEDEPIGARTFDDLFAVEGGARLAISGAGRRVALVLGPGYPHAQVYAPPGGRFVCLEPMTAPTNALVTGACGLVPPGAVHTSTFAVEVSGPG